MKLTRKKQQRQSRRSAPDVAYTDRYTFRRNRTLTGSLSSDVASANEHRSELQSSRVQAHHLRRHRRKLGLALLVVAVIVAALAWAIWQSIVTVRISVVDGAAQPVDTKPYTDEIEHYLSSHPFERNRLAVNTGALTAYLQEHGHPEVKQLTLSMKHSQIGAATFDVLMRQPVVSWKTGGTQLFVDSNGVAFKYNYYTDPSVEVIDQTGIQAVNNQVLASNRFLGFIGLIIGHLREQGYSVTKVVLPVDTTHQLQVSVKGVRYAIKVSVDRSAADQAEDIARSVRYLAQHHITPSHYIDVRVSGRAYYR